jgi:hypothetical protein
MSSESLKSKDNLQKDLWPLDPLKTFLGFGFLQLAQKQSK